MFHKLITQQRRILKVKEGTQFSRTMWWEKRKHCNYTSVLHISKTIEMERMLQVFLLELLISQIFEQQKNVSVAVIISIKCQVYERSGVKYYILEENWGCQQKNENKFWSGCFLPNIEHSVMLPLSFDCSFCQLSNKIIERTQDI